MARRPRSKKTTASQRPRRLGATRRKVGEGLRRGWGIIRHWPWLRILLVSAAVSILYVAYLDYHVRHQFEGKRWALPAHVYARPLELFPGLVLSQTEFREELRLLGYRLNYQPIEPGSFSAQGDQVFLTTRPFTFWDGAEPMRHLKLVFQSNRINEIIDTETGTVVNLLRMDPVFIGGIYPRHHEDRILIKLDEAPPLLLTALLVMEDRNFPDHFGVDPKAIARALLANLRAGSTVQGGSTLTQQLVKNFFLDNRRTLWRKLKEAIMAILLEAHYSKNEILEAYLNEVYLGQDGSRAIHGFGLASRFYFDKPIQQLNTAEVATLVALVRGPTYYSPHRFPKRLLDRRNLVLQTLVEQGFLDAALANQVKQAALGISPNTPGILTHYPAFVDLVRRQLRQDYREEDLTSEGLRIFTSLDPLVQQRTETSLRQISELDKRYHQNGALEGAAVVTNVTTGEVQAMVGGRDIRFAGFNRALDAVRPVGSLLKPFIYLTALQQPDKYNWLSHIEDTSISIKAQHGEVWTPKNYDLQEHGDVTFITALSHSYNLAAVRLGMTLGFEPIEGNLKRLGFQRDIPSYPSTLLGAAEMSPFEVAQMYETLASGGFQTPLRAIREVLTVNGKPLQRFPIRVQQTLEAEPIQVLNSGLMQVVQQGTGSRLMNMLPAGLLVAGKTGTTDDLRDSWFAGYSADHAAVVWLGRDDNQPTGLTGASGALPVWGELFAGLPTQSLQLVGDDKVEYHWVLPDGRPSHDGCKGAMQLGFLHGTAPVGQEVCETRSP